MIPRTSSPDGRPTTRGNSLGIEWFGQTAASLCWMASVFVCGIEDLGDGLQLAAASAWLVANLATLRSARSHAAPGDLGDHPERTT